MAKDLDWGNVYADAAQFDDALDCEVCGEGDGPYDDVVAEFWIDAERRGASAHAMCGEDQGWRLA